jgi:hypothetical protein
MKASRHEEPRYQLRPAGSYVAGEWDSYDIMTMDGKSVIGIVSKRSGGGWVATIPVFGVRDNGVVDVRVKIGTAIGRGQTPAEALEEADRRSLEGITGYDDYRQEGIL